MANLFLSYAREDASRASTIAHALAAEGFSVFWDTDIPAGQTWADFIEAKLTSSAAVLVLWSEASTKSQWVREEARMGRDSGKLIPVQLDASMPPFGFGEVQAANLQAWSGDRASPDWQRLVAAIRFALERSGRAAPPPQGSQPPSAQPRPQQQSQPTFAASAPAGAQGQTGAPKKTMLIAGGIGAALAALVGYAYLDSGDRVHPSPSASMAAPSMNTATASLPASIEAVVREAAAAEQAGRAAAEEATQLSGQGMQAANAATTNQRGYMVQQMPNGGVVAGDLATMMAGGQAFVGLAAPNGFQFYGRYQQLNPTDYTSTGAATWGAMNAAGTWRYAANSYDYVGLASVQGRFNGAVRESGSSLATEGTGVGVFTFPDGRRYAGQYRSAGEGPQVQIFMHGRGALYAPNGDVLQAGRFENDRLVAPE